MKKCENGMYTEDQHYDEVWYDVLAAQYSKAIAALGGLARLILARVKQFDECLEREVRHVLSKELWERDN